MEKEIVLLTASLENHCQYCAAGYTIALRKLRADEEMIKSIRARETVKNDKYNALVDLTRSIVIERGNPDEAVLRAFRTAGYSEKVIMDILTGVAMKTIATYFFHIFPVTIDKEYEDGVDFLSIEEAMQE